ncbi:SWIM zinc finger family protein [Burkholderia pseudomultivorans]|uniref:SWIM zinc finger family protein n=1 Tax=Burkholderia pseudomultivorans TaxID=1207504 RepID=UPI00188E8B79|nr:SWIM zinc finger family protein [Burkholderia pseudomultivorans]MBF5008936.1 SWIM zinc finger family protein [Burkholderia pseudomultivorans]
MSAPVRDDLLELTPEALTALANAGFVKRAPKDVAAGAVPVLAVDGDGTVHASFDGGVRTSLPPGRTLRDAACSCTASGMCRHRVMLVLAYQASVHANAAADAGPGDDATAQVESPDETVRDPEDAPHGETRARASDAPDDDAYAQSSFGLAWSPADFDDAALAASFAPSVLEQAARMAAARPVVAVQSGAGAHASPVARLPMCSVRFFSRRSLAHARCDCRQGSGCVHVVLAVWAFRQAGPLTDGASETMIELRAPAGDEAASDDDRSPLRDAAAQALIADLDGLLRALWLDGSSQPTIALAARVESLRGRLRERGWQWVDDALDEAWQLVHAQHARSSRFEPLRLVRVLAELWARVRAAACAATQRDGAAVPARQVLGIGVKGEVELDHLRLVSLGVELWADDAEEGASVLFADPDTQTVMVLTRNWPRAADAAAGGRAPDLAARRVAGFPLRQIAAGQVVTKAATRRANGALDIAAGVRQTGVLPLSPKSWDDLVAPIRQSSIAALVAHLRDALPDFVRPRQAANGAAAGASGSLHIVAFEPMLVRSIRWDAAAQVLHARLAQCEAEAVEAGDEVLHLALPHRAVAPGAVDALARALSGEWGALRAVAGTVCLHAGEAVMRPLAVLTAQRAVVLQTEAAAPQPLPLHGGRESLPALVALAEDTLALLAEWLRQGMRHQGGGAIERALAQAARLERAGLAQAGRLLRALTDGLHAAQPASMPAQLGALTLLLLGIVEQ